MIDQKDLLGSLQRLVVIGYALCTIGLLSSCASTGTKSTSPAPSTGPNRSELVFLNISEASGWVAYNCGSGESEEMEDYRVVVIRQNTGKVIYDSQVRLTADLCTHGFEMAQDDPRLKRLANNVDSGIIDPLEAYQKSVKAAETPAPEPTATPVPSNKVAPQPKATPKPTPALPKETTIQQASGETFAEVAADTTYGKPPFFVIKSFSEKEVILTQTSENLVKKNDRLFLKKRPELIAIPGTDQKVLVSEGEVTGLVEVLSIDNLTITTKLLTGEIPTDGIAEKVENP